MRVLLAGWFSFDGMGATAGDLLSRDVVSGWLTSAGVPFDIATAPPFSEGIDWQLTRASEYSHVIFVCGPFGNGPPVTEFLAHFSGRRLIGLNLSMLQQLGEWNPFDLLLERDSSKTTRPDLSFLSQQAKIPVIGLILVHPQQEYRHRSQHDRVHALIHQSLDNVEAAIVPIDTRLDRNASGLRTSAEVESLIAKMDVVVTTRLHGTVLALKNGVPVVAVDPISGGAKITAQTRAVGWPVVFSSEDVSKSKLEEAYAYCLSAEARELAENCSTRAAQRFVEVQNELLTYLNANE